MPLEHRREHGAGGTAPTGGINWPGRVLHTVTPARALVVGAGHHGLVCAGSLAEAGWEVTLVEQEARPGGAVHSCEGPPGFAEDPCSGYFPLTRASPAFEAIGLERFVVGSRRRL
jgi:phytoene dehydrogenase-like protein